MERDEIVFEDLHGIPEGGTNVVVDLDADDKNKGITRVADDEAEDRAKPNGRDDDDTADRDDEGDEPAIRGRADSEEEEADDDDDYSKRVKKRIDRERKQTQKARDEADYWREQAEATKKQLGEYRTTATKDQIRAIDDQITATEKELEDAVENGKSADQVKLVSRLTDLKAKRITTEIEGRTEGASDTTTDSGRVRPSGGVPKLAKEWMDEQSDWYGKPGFERQSRLANRIDREVHAEGYDVNDPDYYKELTRRLRKQAPDLFDEADDREYRGRARERRSPVAAVDRAGSERSKRSSRVELRAGDFENMRRFGLDPNNAAHLKEYAQNVRESDADDRRRREGGR